MSAPRKRQPKLATGVDPTKRQPVVLSCSKCPMTIAANLTLNEATWPQHRCRATFRPAPFTAAKLDTENRHSPMWKV